MKADDPKSAEILAKLAEHYPEPVFQNQTQTDFLRSPGPTAAQIADLSAQCTDREWDRLVTNRDFIEAACRSLEQSAQIASQLLGRKLSVPESKPKNESHENTHR